MKPRPNHSPFHTRNRNRIAILVGWPELGWEPDGPPDGLACREFDLTVSRSGNPVWQTEAPRCEDVYGAGWKEIVSWHPCASNVGAYPFNSVQGVGGNTEPLSRGLPEIGNYLTTGLEVKGGIYETCPNPSGKDDDPCLDAIKAGRPYEYQTKTAVSTLGSSNEVGRQQCAALGYAWYRVSGAYVWKRSALYVGGDGGDLTGTQASYYRQYRLCCRSN